MAAKTIFVLTRPSVRIDTILRSPAASTVTATPVAASIITGANPSANTVISQADDSIFVLAIP